MGLRVVVERQPVGRLVLCPWVGRRRCCRGSGLSRTPLSLGLARGAEQRRILVALPRRRGGRVRGGAHAVEASRHRVELVQQQLLARLHASDLRDAALHRLLQRRDPLLLRVHLAVGDVVDRSVQRSCSVVGVNGSLAAARPVQRRAPRLGLLHQRQRALARVGSSAAATVGPAAAAVVLRRALPSPPAAALAAAGLVAASCPLALPPPLRQDLLAGLRRLIATGGVHLSRKARLAGPTDGFCERRAARYAPRGARQRPGIEQARAVLEVWLLRGSVGSAVA